MKTDAQGVYKITHRESGKAYIGKAARIDYRWARHIKDAGLGRGHAIHCALRKYGVAAFDFEALEYCDGDESTQAAEKYWIEWYGTIAPGGYNLTEGGEGGATFRGRKHTEETRARMRTKKSPEHVAKVAAANIGKKRSAESNEKNRQRHLGVRQTQESKAKIAASMKALRAKQRAAGEDINAALRGRKRSEETIAKLRAAWVVRKARTAAEQ